jgi:hypothetical protein
MNRSRQVAYMTGTHGMDNVKGIDEMGESNGFNNGNKNYQNAPNVYGQNYNASLGQGGMFGTVFMGNPDYVNPMNNLHNNIGDRVMLEQTFDNKIFIDTSFKDYSKHPEPFKFIVKFNATDPTTKRISVTVDNDLYDYSKYMDGETEIVFDRIFKNVKYVNVNAMILPNCIDYKTLENGSYVPCGKKLANATYKYLILKIDELKNGRCYSNNQSLGKEFFIMKKDDDASCNNQIWIPIYKNIGYFDSQLKFVDRLTVEICDDKGKRLCTTLDGNNYDFFADYRKTIDMIKHLKNVNTQQSNLQIESLVPKLKSLKLITDYLAPELHLTFNTLEPQIDTKPMFRH